MASKLWLDLLLWGLGDRLEGSQDYKTDILLVVNLMTWFSTISLTIPSGGFIVFLAALLLAPLALTPLYWIGTQIGVGFVMAKKAGRTSRRKVNLEAEREEEPEKIRANIEAFGD